jgi:outer membrane biosynthesis protein TonB
MSEIEQTRTQQKQIIMKTITILLTSLLLSSQLSFAQHLNNENSVPSIQQKIQNNIRVPQTLLQQNGEERVRVVFSIDENGNVNIVDINTSNPGLIKDVRRQFESMNFSGNDYKVDTEYSIWLTFKVL